MTPGPKSATAPDLQTHNIPNKSTTNPPAYTQSQLTLSFDLPAPTPTIEPTITNTLPTGLPLSPPPPNNLTTTLPDVRNSPLPALDLQQLLTSYKDPYERKYANYVAQALDKGTHVDDLDHSGRTGTRRLPSAREDAIISDVEQVRTNVSQRQQRIVALINQFETATRKAVLPTDPREIRVLARQAIGADPTAYIDEIYDALEAATNRVMRSHPMRSLALWNRLMEAQRWEENLGKRTRTLEITRLQQFSTPHPIAEAVAYAADTQPADTVLEPTAGTGNLVEPLLNTLTNDHQLTLNEIDPRRATILTANGYANVTTADYLRFTPTSSPTVIVTNPPWGKTTRNLTLDVPAPWGRFYDISERFIVKNLRELRDGGRLVAVMPTTILNPGAAAFRKWIDQNHTLRAMIQTPPNAYVHRGTTVDSIILVVDKGKIPNAQKPILWLESQQPKDWTQYAEALTPLAEGGSHARTHTKHRELPEPTSLGNHALDQSPRQPTRPHRGPGLSELREPRSGPGYVRPDLPRVDSGLVSQDHVSPSLDQPRTDPSAHAPRPTHLVRQSTRALRPTNVAPARAAEFDEAERSPIFTPYVLRSPISGNPHPRQVVETRSLAGAPAPQLTYRPHPAVFDAHQRQVISDEQFDVIAAVGQAVTHEHGYLAADDVGVGKSREIAGVAIDWFESGRSTRILYTSKSEVNLRDFESELRIVTGVTPAQELPYKLLYLRDFPDSAERAQKKNPYVMPPAYDNTIYLVESHNLTAFRRAIEDLNFDGILADEVHTYKNEDAGLGQTWKSLHRNWLEAKRPIAYFSATPGATLEDLQYLYGLREWDIDGFTDWVERATGHSQEPNQEKRKNIKEKNTDLSDKIGSDGSEISKTGRLASLGKALQNAIEANDEPAVATIRREIANFEKEQKRKSFGQNSNSPFHIKVSTAEMEQIMRELKMKGKYGSRDLWRGGVEFEGKEMPLTPEEQTAYNAAVLYMRDVEQVFQKYKGENQAKRNAFGITAFLQAAAKRRLFDFRIRRALTLAADSLDRGEQPVISVINVNPTQLGEGYMAAALNGINVRKVLMDAETAEITDLGDIPEAVIEKNQLLEREEKEFPPSPDPIELIQKRFGKDKVAVITGDESPQVRVRMKEDFQKGIRTVGIISGAGKTGISLHHVAMAEASGLFEGQTVTTGRRHLIQADYEWSATQFKQELGRVDRAGQITPPRITAITLGSAAETKFIATIANRMKTLGAVSKGAAESTGTAALEHFELGGDIDNMVLRNMWPSMAHALRLWFRGKHFIEGWVDGTPHPKDSILGAGLRDFLLELQLMPIGPGNQIWDHFWQHREAAYTGQAVAEREAHRTQKFSGQVLRRTQLQPDLELYEVEDAGQHHAGILSGMVTEHMHLLAQFLDTVTEKVRTSAHEEVRIARKHREYISFTGQEGELISGLRLRPGQIQPIAKTFGKATGYQHAPATALQDILAGDSVPLHNEWTLRLGKAGEKKGYIVIDGAKISNTDRGKLVLNHGGKYNPVSGGFFFLPQDQAIILKFLERFPIKKQLTEGSQLALAADQPNTPSKHVTPFTNGRLVDNPEHSNIRLHFNNRPNDTLITLLARQGFQFSPENQSWDRVRNDAAYRAVNQIILFLNKSNAPSPSRER